MFKEIILNKAEEIRNELIEIRRDIHAHPEIGLQEKSTSALVAKKLKELGLEVKTNIGITGVIGLLKGKFPGKTILLRADMDCLEMTELNNIDYKSQYAGRMHACGHDAHTTWLLGAAMILADLKNEIHGNVKFLFQPAEETEGGADRMIKDGALEDPKVNAIIGAHVWPIVEAGKIGIKYGSMMAAPDHFKITIFGKGGHGAEPHNSVDPIAIGSQVYMGLQNIISRKVNPIEPAVITVGKINGGSAFNVIPEKIEMEGTARTLTNELRNKMPIMMEQCIKGITEAYGGTYEFKYTPYYPPVINDDEVNLIIEEAGKRVLGNDGVVMLKEPTMGGEDFSYFQQKVPGAFFFVGTLNESKGINKPLHSPYFNIDENIISKASAVMAESALLFLNKN